MSSDNEKTFTYRDIAFFRAICNSCKFEFGYPMLGDMLSYGEFIAVTERGGQYAYVSAFTGEWDEINKIIQSLFPSEKSDDSRGDRLQWVIGRCLDPLDGQKLSINIGPICPHCHSRDISYGDSERLGFLRVPDATWRLKNLSLPEKKQLITTLWEESRDAANQLTLEKRERLQIAWERHMKKLKEKE